MQHQWVWCQSCIMNLTRDEFTAWAGLAYWNQGQLHSTEYSLNGWSWGSVTPSHLVTHHKGVL